MILISKIGLRIFRGIGLAFLCLPFAQQPAHSANVVILLSAEVEQYEDAVEGLIHALHHEVVEQFDMGNNFDRGRRILSRLRGPKQPDLIIAIGNTALTLLAEETPQYPVVYAMVVNPSNLLGADARITGASMNVGVERSIEIIAKFGQKMRRIGVLFNPLNTGYLMEGARAAAREADLDLIEREVSSFGDSVNALESLIIEGIDALWILPDVTVLQSAVFEHLLLVCHREGIPLVGLTVQHAEMGALFSVHFTSSQDIGRQAAELANRILDHAPLSSLHYTTAREVSLTINMTVAEKLGIAIPDSLLRSATGKIR